MADIKYDDSQFEKMHYKDSWLQNTVELAALGTILTGAGTLAVKGNLAGGLKGNRAIGALGKGFENYLRRKGSLGQRFGYNLSKKTFSNLRKQPKPTKSSSDEVLGSILGTAAEKVDDDPAIQQRIRKEVGRRLSVEQNRRAVDEAIDGSSRFSKTDQEERARILYQKVRGEEINKLVNDTPDVAQKAKRSNNSSNNSGPKFNKREIARDVTVSGLTGVGFGAGISGFHALDRLSSNPDAQKNLEDSFQYAGSFLNKKEDDNSMRKQADATGIYNSLKGFGRKTPESIMGGIGFTGVSLGTAKVLNDQGKLGNGENKPNDGSTRVIIELGNENTQDNPTPSLPMGLSSLPKINNYQEKTAAPLFSSNRLKQFGRDFKGYDKQIRDLKNENPADIAADRLKNEDVNDLVKQRYGNLADTEYNQSQFKGKLFDSYTQQAKKEIDDNVYDLGNRQAKARLQAGGALLGTGGGLAAISLINNKKESGKEQP